MTDAMENVAVAEPLDTTMAERHERAAQRPKLQPRYSVIIWDDSDHSYDYVIKMLMQLFAHPLETAYQMASEVDASGKVVVLTTTMEHAELKRDQIHAFGRDGLITNCVGAMWSTIEPAPGT